MSASRSAARTLIGLRRISTARSAAVIIVPGGGFGLTSTAFVFSSFRAKIFSGYKHLSLHEARQQVSKPAVGDIPHFPAQDVA